MREFEYEKIEYTDGEISYHKFAYKLRAGGKSMQKFRVGGFCARLPIKTGAAKPKKTAVTKAEYREAYAKRVIWEDVGELEKNQ